MNVNCVITPSVPSEPTISRGRLYPAAFFTTRPPPAKTSPRPSIARNADQVVADRAMGVAPRTAGIGRHDAADSRTGRLGGIDRQPLPLLRPNAG